MRIGIRNRIRISVRKKNLCYKKKKTSAGDVAKVHARPIRDVDA